MKYNIQRISFKYSLEMTYAESKSYERNFQIYKKTQYKLKTLVHFKIKFISLNFILKSGTIFLLCNVIGMF